MNLKLFINDQDLANKIVQSRKSKHNQGVKPIYDFTVGQLVYIKADKSKLATRKQYIITEIFTKDDEQFATLQKTDTQFRQKEYTMKLAEIMPIPGKPEPKPLADKLEEEMLPLERDEVDDEFLVNNLTTKAHEIIDNIAGMIMKTKNLRELCHRRES